MKNIIAAAAIASLIMIPLHAGLAQAQSADPAWLDDLKQQIALDEKCEVSYFLNMREGKLGADLTFEARVQCADGRMFDASRIGENNIFTFKRCETQVC
ncbi:MAG: hypothetical protein KDJ67_10215 [Nitratireductor sp.]|nr:hypothetical protein [Nitratireductor sp.]MCB1450475.1 hypothetical protein [Nitratireductor sp.]